MKNISVLGMIVLAMLFQSCGSSKQVANAGYYNNPYPPQNQQQTIKELKTLKVDELVAEETDRMRAVGMADDVDEADARREALQAAQVELASLLETAVVALTQEYNKKTKSANKKLKEEDREEFIELTVSQKVSVKPIGAPERFMLGDGSFRIYRCVELQRPTAEVLGEIHDELTKEEVLGVDYGKKKFIEDNLSRIQELRDKSK